MAVQLSFDVDSQSNHYLKLKWITTIDTKNAPVSTVKYKMNFKSRSLNIYGENMNAVSVQTSRQWSYISGQLKSWCFVPRQANWERPAWPTRTARKRLKTAGVWIAHQMTTAAQRFRASASAKMASYKSDCCSAVIVSKLLLLFDPPWSTRSRGNES